MEDPHFYRLILPEQKTWNQVEDDVKKVLKKFT